MSSTQLVKHSALYAIGNIANKVAGFLMLPLYTFNLTTEDYGVIEYVDLLIMVFAILFGLHALGSALIRIYHDTDKEQKESVVATALLISFVLSGVIALLGYIYSESISLWLLKSTHYSAVIELTFISLIFVTQIELLLIYKRLQQQAVYFVVFSLLRLLVNISLNIYFIAFLKLGIYGFVYSMFISAALFSLVPLIEFMWQHPLRLNRVSAHKMFTFGTPLVFASLAMYIIHFLDRFVLGHFHSLEQVGLYALAYKFAFLVSVLIGEPFKRVWEVNVFSYAETENWKAYFAKVYLYYTIALFGVAIGISLFIDNLLGWAIDPKFAPAFVFTPILIIGYAIREQGDFFKQILFINKRSNVVGKISTYSALINIALSFLFIPSFGPIGAAIATLITWVFYTIYLWYLQYKEFHIEYPKMPLTLVFLLTFAAIGSSYFYSPSSLLLNSLVDIAIIIILLVLLFVFNIIDKDDQTIIQQKSLALLKRKKSI